MRGALAALFLSSLAVVATAQNLTIAPTTTYAAETGVNTSEPAGFSTQTDGNLGGANVSKVDTHTLLYPGFDGKVYAHVVGWFGGSNHENIGYNSSDPAVVKAQIDDMVSRGIDGIMHVWYGPGTNISNLEAQAVMNEAVNHSGFTFSISIDKGAIQWGSCYPSCTATQAVINLTTYVANTYFSSPAYLRINGRPVLMDFAIDGSYTVDWNQVAAATPGNPIFLFQNNGGFTHTQTGGSYAWVMPSDSNYGLDYLGSFYSTGMQYPALTTVGATYKGFNDTLASWSLNRIMNQQCGQTWLSTFDKINSMYSSANQLPMVQLVTWDDYEEGTEIETGIDNCVTVTASTSGSVLNWAISGGNENTIDHYTVFISTDGQNLMSLGDFAAGTHSLDISSFNPAAGTYTLYVKAVGKPSIANKMSNAATLTIGSVSATPALSVTPNSGAAPLTVTATATSTSSSTLSASSSTTTTSIDFGDGTVVSGSTATHTYSAPGSYTVKATFSGSTGSSTSTASVNATAVAPTAALSLSATTGAAPVTVTASTSASTDSNSGGSITGSVIDWGDGTTSAGPTASHTYSNAGTYAVTATVTDNYGASAKATQTMNVTAAVAAGVTITSPTGGSTVGSPVHLVATASSATGVAAMSSYIDDVKVYKTYTASTDFTLAVAPGSHHLVINAWDSNGVLLPQASEYFTVSAQAPAASLSLSANSGTAPATITATASATDPNVNGTISSYSISWGDGSTSAGASASHTYSNAGTYTVKVTTTDNYGQSGTASQTVTIAAAVNPAASLSLSATAGTAPVTITATVSGTDPNAGGSITSSSIAWGDGSTSAGPSASHTYSNAGAYTVTATVTDNYGKSGSTSQLVTVTAPVATAPTAAMTVTMSGPTATVSTSGSTAGSGTITSTIISWGDGTSTAATSASHTYARGGYYTITVTVSNSNNLSASTSQQVTAAGVVIWLPQPGATASQPVHIAATAYDSRKIASMIIYLDYKKVWTGYVNDFDVWLKMSSGKHLIVVKAWEDVTGKVYQSSVRFNAQ